MLIFLIGMPGSGKSTIGRLLAEEMTLPFFDTDSIIESIQDMTIGEIIRQQGEASFRDMEASLMRSWKMQHGVVATGGGLPCHNGMMEILQSLGKTVFLRVSPEVLAQRLQGDTDRPLLDEQPILSRQDLLEQMYHRRTPYYEAADIIADADASPKDIIAFLVAELRDAT